MNKEYLKWLNGDFVSKEDKEILSNMSDEEIEESFNEELVFGTAGIRGTMGLGISKLNKYTISYYEKIIFTHSTFPHGLCSNGPSGISLRLQQPH